MKYDPSKYVNPGYEKPEGNIPGTQSIYVKTFGCSHNISDSEVMTGILAKYGYNIVDAPE